MASRRRTDYLKHAGKPLTGPAFYGNGKMLTIRPETYQLLKVMQSEQEPIQKPSGRWGLPSLAYLIAEAVEAQRERDLADRPEPVRKYRTR